MLGPGREVAGGVRAHDLVVLRGDLGVADVAGRLVARVELGQERRARGLLPSAGISASRISASGFLPGGLGDRGAVVGRCDADQVVDHPVAAEELDVVARHHPALRVADHRDLGRAGGVEHPLGERPSAPARRSRMSSVRAVAVVERVDAEPGLLDLARQPLQQVLAVAEGAVDEDDRRGSLRPSARTTSRWRPAGPRPARSGRSGSGPSSAWLGAASPRRTTTAAVSTASIRRMSLQRGAGWAVTRRGLVTIRWSSRPGRACETGAYRDPCGGAFDIVQAPSQGRRHGRPRLYPPVLRRLVLRREHANP